MSEVRQFPKAIEPRQERSSSDETPNKRRKLSTGKGQTASQGRETERADQDLPQKSNPSTRRHEAHCQISEGSGNAEDGHHAVEDQSVPDDVLERACSEGQNPSNTQQDGFDLEDSITTADEEEVAALAVIVGEEAEAGRHLSLEPSGMHGQVRDSSLPLEAVLI